MCVKTAERVMPGALQNFSCVLLLFHTNLKVVLILTIFLGHRQHNLLHPVGGQIEEYNKKTTFTQRLVLGKGSFLVSETRWYCNLARCIVGLRVCLFWEGNIFRSPLWLMHLSGILTMWMSELKKCAHVCEREKERDQESERLREREGEGAPLTKHS